MGLPCTTMYVGTHLVTGGQGKLGEAISLLNGLRPHRDGDSGLGVAHFQSSKALRGQASCPPLVLPESRL